MNDIQDGTSTVHPSLRRRESPHPADGAAEGETRGLRSEDRRRESPRPADGAAEGEARGLRSEDRRRESPHPADGAAGQQHAEMRPAKNTMISGHVEHC
ncbi:MAG TPA: hypothetical protein PK992_18635 [Planctomycetaceae bacterium]|nr:hypothetical protein [Planctomycetaceae bacterium]